MPKTKTIAIVAGLGIAGILAYEWWKKKQATASASTGTGTGSGSSPYILPPTMTTLPATTIPSTPVNSVASGNAIDPAVLQAVQNWAHADGRAPVLAMANALVPSEYAGMYDIITNFWNKGVTVQSGSQQQQFWDALRDKYDPSHNTW